MAANKRLLGLGLQSIAISAGLLIFANECADAAQNCPDRSSTIELCPGPPVKMTGGEVLFNPGEAIPEDAFRAETLRARKDMVHGGSASYVIYADLQSIEPVQHSYFGYDLYIHRKTGTDRQVYFMRLQARPIGNFPDDTRPVPFTLIHGDQKEEASVELPLHSFGVDQFVHSTTTVKDSPIPVDLTSGETIEVKLKNEHRLRLHVDVNAVRTERRIGPAHPSNWDQDGIVFESQTRTTVPPVQDGYTILRVRLKPKPFAALSNSMGVLQPDKEHDRLNISVPYRVDLGGESNELQFAVKIRFTPSFWALLTAVVLGAAVGGMIAALLSDRKVSRRTLAKSWIAGIGLACIAELLAMIVATAKSKFTLFGVDLDPWQLLPASALGALVAVYGSRKLLKDGKLLGLSL